MSASEQLSRLKLDPEMKKPVGTGRRLLRWIVAGVIGAGLIGLLMALPYIMPMEVEAQPVKVLRAEVTTSAAVLSVTGYVIPHKRIEVAPKIIGRVAQVFVEKGDLVTSGKLLVRLEDVEQKANRDRAAAALLRAEAELDRLKNGNRPQEIEEARAQAQLFEAQVRDTSQTLARARSLVLQRAEGEQYLDRARNDFDVARARLLSAQKRLDLMLAGSRAEDVKAAEASVLEARANLELADSILADTKILAPGAGTVLERLVEPGEMVTNAALGGSRGARTALMSVANLKDMQVEIDLNQVDLGKVRIGQQCTVGLEAYPDAEWMGYLAEMAPEANRQKATVQVKVQIADPDARVRPELTARVTFLEPLSSKPGEKSVPRLFVPASAMVERQGRSAVALVDHGRVKFVVVRRGEETPDGVRILEGVGPTDTVITKPADGLKEGVPVKLSGKAKPTKAGAV